jgi:hypothetical protein
MHTAPRLAIVTACGRRLRRGTARPSSARTSGSSRFLALIRSAIGDILVTGEQDSLGPAPYRKAIVQRYSSEGVLETMLAQALLDVGGSDVGRGRSGRVLVLGDAGAGSADIGVARVLVP